MLRTNSLAQRVWATYRRNQLIREYTVRREMYARRAAGCGLVYDRDTLLDDLRKRLADRHRIPAARSRGDVHTLSFIPDIGWHRQLLGDLRELGPVSNFDYVASGYGWREFTSESGVNRRRKMNEEFLAYAAQVHAQRPVDWIFVYASGLEVLASSIEEVGAVCSAPTVNMCLDDKQSWEGPAVGGQRLGQIDIAAAFDLSWTSARVALEWYLLEGGRPVYMPEGFDLRAAPAAAEKKNIPVSFIGAAYGYRPAVIRHIRRHGIDIRVFGDGWGRESRIDNAADIMTRSVINLGMGGIGYHETLTNVKGRDFEVVGAGGGVYLTTYNSDLAQHFHIGREILCYGSREEMIELIRYYLARPGEAHQIAERGRERCLREHRWLHRYQQICRILGILND